MPVLQYSITQKFKQYLQQLGYSKSTINMLPACVTAFLSYNNIQTPKHIQTQHINNFYEYLQQRKHQRKATTLSQTYIHHNIYAIKVFLKWLEQTHQINQNPISNLKFKQPQSNTREPLTTQQIQQLFNAAQTLQQTTILHLFYSCGLRRNEAENLNLNDIHFTQNLLYVREGKGAKRRVIPITEKVKTDIQNYCNKERKPNKSNTCEALMYNTKGNRMKGDSYNKVLKKLLIINHLSLNISLHHLRHSIATHLLQNGLSVEYVKEFLGHSQLETTQIYTKVFKHQLQKL